MGIATGFAARYVVANDPESQLIKSFNEVYNQTKVI